MIRTFLNGILGRLVAVYRGTNFLWHITAAVLTYVLVASGFDWYFFEVTRSPLLRPIIFAAGIGGFLVPVITPITLYIIARVRKNVELLAGAVASGQAALLALAVSFFYKTFTGRIQPELFTATGGVDISHEFQFGILRNGVFWGWPSSHAMVACAFAASLFIVFARRASVRYLVVLYAVIVCLGAAIGFHWFSDVVAGIIIGTLIGTVVGGSVVSYTVSL